MYLVVNRGWAPCRRCTGKHLFLTRGCRPVLWPQRHNNLGPEVPVPPRLARLLAFFKLAVLPRYADEPKSTEEVVDIGFDEGVRGTNGEVIVE